MQRTKSNLGSECFSRFKWIDMGTLLLFAVSLEDLCMALLIKINEIVQFSN